MGILSYKIMVTVFFILFNVNAICSDSPSSKIKEIESGNTYFILQNISWMRTDLAKIKKPETYNLVLLTSNEGYKKLTEKQKNAFNKIILIETFNFESIQKKVESLIKEGYKPIEFLTRDEYALAITGKLRDEYKTKAAGYKKVDPFLNKDLMKKRLIGTPLRLPKYTLFSPELYRLKQNKYLEEVAEKLTFPIFAKPIDGCSSHHTKKINTFDELSQWAKDHAESDNYELDEFIEGTLYHCDSLIFNGEVMHVGISRYAYPCYDTLGGKPTASIVLSADDPDFKALYQFNRQVATALFPIPNGGTHLEVFKKANGEFVFLEIAARPPGGLVPQMYEKYYGLDLDDCHFKLQMGILCDFPKTQTPQYFAAWAWFPIQKGVIESVQDPLLKSFSEINWEVKVGDIIKDPESIADSALTVVIWSNNQNFLKQDFKYLSEHYNPYKVRMERFS